MALIRYDKGRGSVAGLHIKTSSKGVESYYLFYRTRCGASRRPKLGEVSFMKLVEARRLAKEWLLMVAQGRDPSLERKNLKKELTVEDLFLLVDEKHWAFTTPDHRRHTKNLCKKHILPRFGSRKLSQVKRIDVLKMHGDLRSTPYSANRTYEALRKMYSWAEEQELIPVGANPCIRIKTYKEYVRERRASKKEIKDIGASFKKYYNEDPQSVTFLYAAFDSGARHASLLRAKWENLSTNSDGTSVLLDFGKSSHKTGRHEKIFFSKNATALITKLPRLSSGLIFGRKSTPRTMWLKIRGEIGASDLRARDSRRTHASLAYSKGIKKSVVGDLLNHHSDRTTSIYALLDDEAKIQAVNLIGAEIKSLMGNPVDVDIFS